MTTGSGPLSHFFFQVHIFSGNEVGSGIMACLAGRGPASAATMFC